MCARTCVLTFDLRHPRPIQKWQLKINMKPAPNAEAGQTRFNLVLWEVLESVVRIFVHHNELKSALKKDRQQPLARALQVYGLRVCSVVFAMGETDADFGRFDVCQPLLELFFGHNECLALPIFLHLLQVDPHVLCSLCVVGHWHV